MFLPYSNPPTNTQIADIFRAVAAAYTVKDSGHFRIVAYQKAADSVENSTQPVYQLWQNHQLQELPGIGGSIKQHLDELFTNGESKYFDEIFDGLPEGMFALLPIPGIGPKNAHKLASHLGLTRYHSALTHFEKSLKQGEIATVPTFGEDSQSRMIKGLEEYKNRSSRLVIHHADAIADQIKEYLTKHTDVMQVESLGSLRRRAATIGDLDFAIATRRAEVVLEYFTQYPQVQSIIECGDISASILLTNGMHVDVITQSPASFGSLLQHFTGSKYHNIALRELALKQGYSLSEKGITQVKTKQIQEFSTEESFYQFLGLQWITPELREDTGEIEAAQNNSLPNLINQSDLKGEFHIHSDFPIEPSHDLGLSSMTAMVTRARELGYEYLAFSEHNPSLTGHDFSQIVELVKNKKYAIDELNNKDCENHKIPVKIFNSLEIDIKPDGTLSLPDDAFGYLDFAIVSIHSSFNQSREDTTKRILTALSHPKAKILGHPTARTINYRSGVDIDWEQLFDFCIKHEKWLDIDGWPDRQDLPAEQIRQAIKYGVKMAISSDAHQVDHMDMIRYGISNARRGWATPEDIINTMSLSQLLPRLP